MPDTATPAELEAFLDEALPPERMAAIEQTLRDGDAGLTAMLADINGRRDAGLHSLGAIWRRRRLTCPTREQLGSYLLGVLSDAEADYIRFHLEEIRCRYCLANLADLQAQQSSSEADAATTRQRKYFQSSVGRLRG
ncbi:MAG: hypothetical protein AAF596_00210 [Planctomycetota bacterium]